jgi:hypothetical protein
MIADMARGHPDLEGEVDDHFFRAQTPPNKMSSVSYPVPSDVPPEVALVSWPGWLCRPAGPPHTFTILRRDFTASDHVRQH